MCDVTHLISNWLVDEVLEPPNMRDIVFRNESLECFFVYLPRNNEGNLRSLSLDDLK